MKKFKVFIAQADEHGGVDIGEIDPLKFGLPFDESEAVPLERTTKLERIYARLREQVNAENQLYTQRIYWLIFIQAFLFATSGLVLQAFLDAGDDHIKNFLVLFLAIIALLGAFVGGVSHYIFMGAREALREIGGIWYQFAKNEKSEELNWFPDVRGGVFSLDKPETGTERYNPIFRSGSLGIAFVVAWLVAAVLGAVFLV